MMLNLAVEHAVSHHKKETEIVKFEEPKKKRGGEGQKNPQQDTPTGPYYVEV